MDEILIILVMLAGVWYWWDTQRCNEVALSVCRKKCQTEGLQLLDATVTRRRTWLRRGHAGSIQICRLYSFEYGGTGAAGYGVREPGYIVLIGKQVVETGLPHRDTAGNPIE